MPLLILSLIVLLLAPSSALAQPEPEQCAYFRERINSIVNGVAPDPDQDFALDLLDLGQDPRCFAEDATARARPPIFGLDFVRRFEGSRGDKQSGAAAGSGSTSIVSQGPAAKVLSFAAEFGAVTQSVKGQVVTIRGNAAGLPAAIVRKGLVPYCVPQDRLDDGGTIRNRFCVDGSALDILRKFSFAVSFNATAPHTEVTGTPAPSAPPSPAGQPLVFEAATNQLASISGRVEILNRRDIASTKFVRDWAAAVSKELTYDELLAAVKAFVTPIIVTPEYLSWQQTHAAHIKAAGQSREGIVSALQTALAELQPILVKHVPQLDQKIKAALAAYNKFFLRQGEMLDEIANKDVLAVEYVNSRPTSQPYTSNVRVIFDAPFKVSHKLVANAAVTWYDTSQTNTDGTLTKFRDAQAAIQYEHALGDVVIIGPVSLSFAVYYQYQHAPAILKVDPLKPVPGVTFVDLPENANTVFAEKGDILLGQVKLSLTPSGSSVKVPLAVTYSNRTELIDKPAWKAQIGVTYDFDSLFARGK